MQSWDTIYTAPGLHFGAIDRVRVVFIGPLISDANHARFVELLAADIDASPEARPMGVLYHIPDIAIENHRRDKIAMVLKERKEKLQRITAAYAMVTDSFIVRGVLKAIWWIAPPPYPSTVVSSIDEAFAYLAARLPGEDAEGLARTYAKLHEHNAWLTDAAVPAPRLSSRPPPARESQPPLSRRPTRP